MAQSKEHIAYLMNKLQMPLIIRDHLVTGVPLNAEGTYALHEMMGNFAPDYAILSAAFVMQEIAANETIDQQDLRFLNMECERLVERYAARDDLAQDNAALWEETQMDMMVPLAEDIEGFIDIITLCHMSFEITEPKIAQILNVLIIQLQSHLVIVDEVIAMKVEIENALDIPAPLITGYAADNVVRFPG